MGGEGRADQLLQVVLSVSKDNGTNDEVHMEICSDVNHSCCDTAMDSMANDFRGINHIIFTALSASFISNSLTICCEQGVHWRSGALRTLVNVQRRSSIRWGISASLKKS